ncbi:GatB/YqeY domain-containing protein [Mesonia oceanica]|uniref:Uncharacterized protein n=1 Tax=Mesonia oceanica TaxID=2687242 RepID=A0AC61Y857_9FLAO|nr:GatB/YqeY domain-containing protein [Mesonia oceanica]MAQ42078.1 glutamyl-tRNA amidotransferase [Mesonia sp.]MBJ97099.1 glutamyl-tRNA amidotransferase [Flavobacteriaceae bacterium]VVV00549.1 hypothetical protein FVB9532_01821 [Mesonia oceanica]|tara:strand:+ start:128 stop:574 length:447 start_codon:yes stop_codon:yes gene_type:complete
MSLEKDVMTQMKVAMKAKDSETLEALRAVKGAIILAKTDNGQQEITEEQEVKLVQKLVKQRKDSAQLYREQNREDLAEPEEKQAEVISQFLPEQLSEAEIEAKVEDIIAQTGAEGMKDMGKVMGIASQQLAGKADGKTISIIVKKKLA